MRNFLYILVMIIFFNTNAYANKYSIHSLNKGEKINIPKVSHFQIKEKKSFFQLLNFFSIERVKKKDDNNRDLIFWVKYNFYN